MQVHEKCFEVNSQNDILEISKSFKWLPLKKLREHWDLTSDDDEMMKNALSHIWVTIL